ncbi:uncharacterized protein EV422DRAFT_232238 [Fimicolochytrium jonesii]|uniref:uncharacterized protein n=1 Tax=Fimicolochytrium jonesii TaxID=1396493 RepID=UPI0022FE9372|nr:uncharacterized protein EV422DRAFT_232238 [Fimicolochytrium jonesii]KAI8817320.1 hypothetical protein EV422DRAFT_232238 [Fimicolochytrium jonesii]
MISSCFVSPVSRFGTKTRYVSCKFDLKRNTTPDVLINTTRNNTSFTRALTAPNASHISLTHTPKRFVVGHPTPPNQAYPSTSIQASSSGVHPRPPKPIHINPSASHITHTTHQALRHRAPTTTHPSLSTSIQASSSGIHPRPPKSIHTKRFVVGHPSNTIQAYPHQSKRFPHRRLKHQSPVPCIRPLQHYQGRSTTTSTLPRSASANPRPPPTPPRPFNNNVNTTSFHKHQYTVSSNTTKAVQKTTTSTLPHGLLQHYQGRS